MDRTARNLNHSKANKPLVLSKFPAKNYGNNGDVAFVRTGTSLSQIVKNNGKWIIVGSGSQQSTKGKTTEAAKTIIINSGSSGTVNTAGAVMQNGSTPFTAVQSGVTPTSNLHLSTKKYVDDSDLSTVTKSGNNLVFGMGDSSNNITFTDFGANAFNSTTIPTSFVTSLSDSASGTGIVGLVDDSSGTVYSLKGGDNISISVEGSESSDYVEIDCSINTNNFLSNTVNRLEGVRKHSADAFDFTQSAGSGKYLVIDDDNSNVSVTESTVSIANGTSYSAIRLNAPTGVTYTTTIPSSTTKLRLVGSNGLNDDVEFVGSGATSVVRTNDSKFTISSANNNDFLSGLAFNTGNGVLTATVDGQSNPTVDLDGRYLTGNESITLSGDASGSGTTSITVTVADDSHNHVQSNIDGLATALAAKADLVNPTFTDDVKIANDLWINGYSDNTASRIRLHHNDSDAYQDWETGNYYIRYDTTTKYMMDSSGNFHADNDVYAYSTSVGSDKKLKTNIKNIKYGLKDILKLRGVDFDWKEKRSGVHDIGVIAQEVQEVIPEIVKEVKDLSSNDSHLTVDYSKLVPVLIEAIKELSERSCCCGVR